MVKKSTIKPPDNKKPRKAKSSALGKERAKRKLHDEVDKVLDKLKNETKLVDPSTIKIPVKEAPLQETDGKEIKLVVRKDDQGIVILELMNYEKYPEITKNLILNGIWIALLMDNLPEKLKKDCSELLALAHSKIILDIGNGLSSEEKDKVENSVFESL